MTRNPLEWMTITSSTSPDFMVKGTLLSRALCGRNNRFAIDEVRMYYAEARGVLDVEYRVRDAETVTDVEVRHGVISRVVARFRTLQAAEQYVLRRVDY